MNQDPLSRLVYELSKLPGIGSKTATRLAYHLLKQNTEACTALSAAILQAKQKVILCEKCHNFTEQSPCTICADPGRNQGILCVAEKPSDVHAIEQTGTHRGRYHVLHGTLSPLEGIGPEELKIRELLLRISTANPESPRIEEVILATNPSVEGEATALYISHLLRPLGVKITKLAHGLPAGAVLEYTDRQTIGKALLNRQEVAL